LASIGGTAKPSSCAGGGVDHGRAPAQKEGLARLDRQALERAEQRRHVAPMRRQGGGLLLLHGLQRGQALLQLGKLVFAVLHVLGRRDQLSLQACDLGRQLLGLHAQVFDAVLLVLDRLLHVLQAVGGPRLRRRSGDQPDADGYSGEHARRPLKAWHAARDPFRPSSPPPVPSTTARSFPSAGAGP
jgi:hypothetical protein